MCCSSHLHGKQFPSILNKSTYFHILISISEFIFPLCCMYQVLSCTCKEYCKDMHFLATSPYYNPTTYTSCESLRNIYIYFDCITSNSHKEDIYKSYRIAGIEVLITSILRFKTGISSVYIFMIKGHLKLWSILVHLCVS